MNTLSQTHGKEREILVSLEITQALYKMCTAVTVRATKRKRPAELGSIQIHIL